MKRNEKKVSNHPMRFSLVALFALLAVCLAHRPGKHCHRGRRSKHCHGVKPTEPEPTDGEKNYLEVDLEYAFNGNYSTTRFLVSKIQVGTPPQEVILVPDTGSADTWLSDEKMVCRYVSPKCSRSAYDPLLSSTFALNTSTKDAFSSSFGTRTMVVGFWSQDTIQVGNSLVEGMGMGLVAMANSELGILGLGPPNYSASNNPLSMRNPFTYDNFPIRLFNQGSTNSTAYSFWLGGEDRPGKLTFGAYDRSKYEGNLVNVPLVADNKYFIEIDEIKLDNVTYPQPENLGYLVDTGSDMLRLPQNVLEQIIQKFSTYDEETWGVDCSESPEGDLTFQFGELIISMPIAGLPRPQVINGQEMFGANGEKRCQLNVAVAQERGGSLGVPFLLKAYSVYDFENRKLSFAKAKHDVPESGDYVPIPFEGIADS